MLNELRKQITNTIFIENDMSPADIIFVPGNAYPYMAERASELYKEGLAPYILPSGKYSVVLGHFAGVADKAALYHGDYKTEWEFLADVLVKNGVPESAILKEDQATYTYENALLSKKVLEQKDLSVKKAILCCRNLHAGRSLMYYQTVFPQVEFLVSPCEIDHINRSNWFTTDEGISAVMAEAERIVRQFSLLM